jgi:hypothetical protein
MDDGSKMISQTTEPRLCSSADQHTRTQKSKTSMRPGPPLSKKAELHQ